MTETLRNTTASERVVERFLSHNVADIQWTGCSGVDPGNFVESVQRICFIA